MAGQDESAITSVCEFTSLDPILDRQLVVAALKAKDDDIEAVVAAFYDDEARFRKTYLWDESSFAGERDTSTDSQLLNFNVQGPDESAVIHGVSPASFHPSAPSRPPSRVSSPLARVADWATSDMNVIGAPLPDDDEDAELQRALAESAAMSGIHTPQETARAVSEGILATTTTTTSTNDGTAGAGAASIPTVTVNGTATAIGSDADTNLPFFGPAHREAYDPNQWAMVRKTPEAQEPGPTGRKRKPGTPAFLRNRRAGTTDRSCLNAILTVLHAIPAARNALLRTGTPPPSYGQNPEWWKGASIASVGTDSDSDSESDAEGGSVTGRDFFDEIHRVMAFLDGTDRAYGTTDNFVETAVMKDMLRQQGWNGSGGGGGRSDMDVTFFHAFRVLGSSAEPVRRALFTDVEVVYARDIDESVSVDNYAVLDLYADSGQYAEEPVDGSNGGSDSKQENGNTPNTIYNAIDSIYWSDLMAGVDGGDDVLEQAKIGLVSRLAPVQIFRLNLGTSGSGGGGGGSDNQAVPATATSQFDIPEVFYSDRYLAENRQSALGLHLRLVGVVRLLQQTDIVRRKLVTFKDPSDNVMRNRVTLSEQAIGFAFQKLWHLKAGLLWRRYEASRASKDDRSDADADKDAAVAAEDDARRPAKARDLDYNLADVDAVEPETAEEVAMFRALQAEVVVHRAKLLSIQKQLRRLRNERAVLERLLRLLRTRHSGPGSADDDGWAPTHSMHLRGVIISANTFFLCRQEEAAVVLDEGSGGGEDDGQPAAAYHGQWWRLSYNVHDTQAVQVTKSTFVAAREAASDTDRPTLIYCSEEALAEPLVPLADTLRTFVRFDNRLFKQEVAEEQHEQQRQQQAAMVLEDDVNSSPRDKKRQPAEDPTSPSKRQQRQTAPPYLDQYVLQAPQIASGRQRQRRRGSTSSSTVDSVTSNRASLGDDDDRELSDREMLDLDDAEPLLDNPFNAEDRANGVVFLQHHRRLGSISSNSSDREVPDGLPGTEMVQLGLGLDDGRGGGGDGSDGSDSEANSMSKPGSIGEVLSKKRASNPPPPLLADWENPEGRYIGPSGK